MLRVRDEAVLSHRSLSRLRSRDADGEYPVLERRLDIVQIRALRQLRGSTTQLSKADTNTSARDEPAKQRNDTTTDITTETSIKCNKSRGPVDSD